MSFLKKAKQVLNNEDGQGLSEYGLNTVIIVLVIIVLAVKLSGK